ncbi:MAG: tRNA guanosine(15) transglycosylase TgtA [Candidatus Diapherotrites archaeon]|nr:tRNA guanosine(15) transglycosylase TgtA [Candidatus Diapherotrites archaeon]
MELRCKDLAARIGFFNTPHGRIETPTILPVVNPSRQSVPAKELKRIGAQAIITNAYLIRQKHPDVTDVHEFLDFDGPVMTDSGAFQLMQYGHVHVTNKEIVGFQERIGVDIGVFLDVPGIGSRETVLNNLKTTLQRAREAKKLTKGSEALWCGPVQGGEFLDLRRRAARSMSKIGFDVYPIGSVVPLMNDYRFADNVDIISTVRKELPLNAPVHHFGAGHPMFFAFAVALGADLFDSAAYSLFAQRGDYLTVNGTVPVKELDELPCSCPICSSRTPQEMDELALSRHNLYVTFQEMRTIRQHIRENRLWELLEQRARAHPALFAALQRMGKHKKYLESLDVFSRKRFFYVSKESELRPELYRHRKRALQGFSQPTVDLFPFKSVPVGCEGVYPFGQRVLPSEKEERVPPVSPLMCLNALAEYQFMVKDLFPLDARVEVSRNTGKIRRVYAGDVLLASVSASDYKIIPHAAAKTIHERSGKWRVVVQDDVSSFARQGKNVFAKFVGSADPDIRAGSEVLVVDGSGALLAAGTASLSAGEMMAFDKGVAVSVRKGFGEANQ